MKDGNLGSIDGFPYSSMIPALRKEEVLRQLCHPDVKDELDVRKRRVLCLTPLGLISCPFLSLYIWSKKRGQFIPQPLLNNQTLIVPYTVLCPRDGKV